MSNFYVGQKVVCVDDFGAVGIKAGSTYVVTGSMECCTSYTFINVPIPPGATMCCRGCGAFGMNGTPGIGYASRRFRPLDSLTEQIERIEEEGVPVELEPEYA